MADSFTPEEQAILEEYKSNHPEIDFEAEDRVYREFGQRLALQIDQIALEAYRNG